MSASYLEAIRDGVASELRRRSELAGVTILARESGNVDTRLMENIESAFGVCVVVPEPRPIEADPDSPDPLQGAIELRLRVYENADRGAAPSGLAVAERISLWLHNWRPNLGRLVLPFFLRKTYPWKVLEDSIESGRLALELVFQTPTIFPDE